MSVTSNPNHAIQILAGEDLSGSQYHVVAIDGTIADNANTAVGILQNKPKSGEDCALAYLGVLKGRCGANIAIGARLTIATSGWITTVASGDGAQTGRAVSAANSGGLVEGIFNFINGHASQGQV